MRGLVSNCVVRRPDTLREALEILAEAPEDWIPLAGGTELMVELTYGQLTKTKFIDISGLEELKHLKKHETSFELGALCTFSKLRSWEPLQKFLPNLIKSAKATGSLAIQNRGTIAGNLVNGSPTADMPPSLIAYGAEVELASIRGSRLLPVESFYLDYKKLDLTPDELVTAIHVPKPKGTSFHFFRKVGSRQGQSVSKLSLAVHAKLDKDQLAEIRLALGAVGPVPIRAKNTEDLLRGSNLKNLPLKEARNLLENEISPLDDERSTAHYRRIVTGNILVQMLGELSRLMKSK